MCIRYPHDSVFGLPSNRPLKLVEVETLMPTVRVGWGIGCDRRIRPQLHRGGWIVAQRCVRGARNRPKSDRGGAEEKFDEDA